MWPLVVTMLGAMVFADGELEVPVEDVRAALLDYGSHPRVVPGLVESDVLERQFDELIVHQRFRLPLLADRDVTLDVTWEQYGDDWIIRFDSSPRVPPMSGGAVPLAKYSGAWQLISIKEGKATRVRFAAAIDFGGNVPRRLAERGLAFDARRLVAGVERLAEQQMIARERNHCPSGVPSARTEIADAEGGVRVLVTAADERAQREIRRRAITRAQEKHEGQFDPNERFAACPGLTPDTVLSAEETPRGVELLVRPFDPSQLERLQQITRELANRFQPETNPLSGASKERRIIF